MDQSAVNYNSLYTTDDGSCIYAGCTDTTANNYIGTVNHSITNAVYPITVDDGSCTYSGGALECIGTCGVVGGTSPSGFQSQYAFNYIGHFADAHAALEYMSINMPNTPTYEVAFTTDQACSAPNLTTAQGLSQDSCSVEPISGCEYLTFTGVFNIDPTTNLWLPTYPDGYTGVFDGNVNASINGFAIRGLPAAYGGCDDPSSTNDECGMAMNAICCGINGVYTTYTAFITALQGAGFPVTANMSWSQILGGIPSTLSSNLIAQTITPGCSTNPLWMGGSDPSTACVGLASPTIGYSGCGCC